MLLLPVVLTNSYSTPFHRPMSTNEHNLSTVYPIHTVSANVRPTLGKKTTGEKVTISALGTCLAVLLVCACILSSRTALFEERITVCNLSIIPPPPSFSWLS